MNVYIKLFWFLFNVWSLWVVTYDERLVIFVSSVILIMSSNISRQLQHLNSMIVYRYMNGLYVSPLLYMLFVIDIFVMKYKLRYLAYTTFLAIVCTQLIKASED